MDHIHFSRRKVLQYGIGALSLGGPAIDLLEKLAQTPQRIQRRREDVPDDLPDIQYDIAEFLAPTRLINGVEFRFGPVYTLFLTATLTRRLNSDSDQERLEDALSTIESFYDFSPEGIFTFVSYGVPYFNRFPSDILDEAMPHLLSNPHRFALQEAVASPTDVTGNNGIRKRRFQVGVRIEKNDVLFTLRSDSIRNIDDVASWLKGESNKLHGRRVRSPHLPLHFTSSRLMFNQLGLPKRLAESQHLPYAQRMHPRSPMWMGFADQQVSGAGRPLSTTFQGDDTNRFTDVDEEHYFFNGSIQHLSHVILDLEQYYGDNEPYRDRCQYMFRSNPIPSLGREDQFTDSGGDAFFENEYRGEQDALINARGDHNNDGIPHMGHLTALQRSSRGSDGTPLHIRMDGPGFDAMDTPDGSRQPKLQFTIFVPTADFFTTMRKNQASLDLVNTYKIVPKAQGLERFLTATRRQNFLVPPRARRAFPLLDLL